MTRRYFAGIATFLSNLFSGRSADSASTTREDIPVAAEWIAKALKGSGYNADFRPESIAEIERFFSEQVTHGQPSKDGLLSRDLGETFRSGHLLRRGFA